MNPGATEEIGQTVRSAFDALKATPVVLAILLFNVILLLGLFYGTHAAAERWERLVEAVLKTCAQSIQREGYRMQSDESKPVELPPLPQARPEQAPKE